MQPWILQQKKFFYVLKPDNTKPKASTLLQNLNWKLTEIPITHIFKGQYFIYELIA